MNALQNNFIELLNKYLLGKAWLAARPYCSDLEDKFYQKVKRPLAELVGVDKEKLFILRLCDKFSAVKVVWREGKKKA